MAKTKKILGTDEAWERGALGQSAEHAKRVSDDMAKEIDEALGLQMISIRLSKSTIDTYKTLAKMHGVGYQPMMRDVLERWVVGEMKQMLVAAHEGTKARPASEKDHPPELPPMRKAA